ncbi:DUF6216 family protein [Pseudomonas chlororaphis]|uniref:DUF6216 family protein n=1 Tax=Pseudomonas chlororaphis TaxID=587753 RepID=UPI0024077B5D|nr:DUF6216 family protein [Pseudomonas chlororaphis]
MADSDTQVQLLDNVVGSLKDINPWITTAIICLLIVWAIARARSAHFLYDRVWRIVGGGGIQNPTLKAYWDDVRDVEGFRFRTGINFPSMEVLLATAKWTKDHNINIKDLSFARGWIRDLPWVFGAPPIRMIRSVVIALLIPFGVLATGTAYMLGSESVLLTIKESKVIFWTDGLTATNFFFETHVPDFSVTPNNCSITPLEGLTQEDVKVICETLSPDNFKEIKKSLTEQRIIAGYFLAVLTYISFILLRSLAQAQMAIKLRKYPIPNFGASEPQDGFISSIQPVTSEPSTFQRGSTAASG